MKQVFANHRIAGAGHASVDASFLDVMSDYFVYIAVVSVAAAAVAVSPSFLESASVGFPEKMAKRTVFASETLPEPVRANKPAGAWRTSTQEAR